MKDVIDPVGYYATDTRTFRKKGCNGHTYSFIIQVSVAKESHEDMWDEITEVWAYNGSFKGEPKTHAYRKACLSTDDFDIQNENFLDMFEDQINEMRKRVIGMRNRHKKNTGSRH